MLRPVTNTCTSEKRSKQRDNFVEEAKKAYESREQRKLAKKMVYDELVERANNLRSSGSSIVDIGMTLGRSDRTVYRMLKRGRTES